MKFRGALTTPDGAPPRWLGGLRIACALVVITVALTVIVGWLTGSTALTSFGNHNDMRPWGAVLSLVAGVALWVNPGPARPRTRLATTLLVIVGTCGLVGLVQVLTGFSFGVAEFFRAHPHDGHPLYASPQSALQMVFFALAQLGPNTRRFSWIRGTSMVLFLIIALTFSVALMFGAGNLVEQDGQPGINLPGSITMMTLSLGLIVVKGRSLPMRWMWQNSLTGTLVRRLLPSMAVLPLILACVTVVGERAGWFDMELGIAMMTVLITAVGVAIVTFTAAVVLRAERRAAGAAAYSQALLDAAPDATVVVDEEGIIRYANAQVERLLGYEIDALIGRSVDILVPDRVRPHHARLRSGYAAAPTLRLMGGGGVELTARHQDGHEIPVEISLGSVATRKGMSQVAALRDVTEKRAAQVALREAQERYRLLAEQDELTGLPNRRRFEADMERHLASEDHALGALIFIELDHFKTVNDTLGHPAGDQLLILVAEAMAEVLPADALIARRGGDEFLILLREGAAAEAETHAQAVVSVVPRVAGAFDSAAAQVSASAGIAVFSEIPASERDCSTAMTRADLALYDAKGSGRSQTKRWAPTRAEQAGTFGLPPAL